jgi:hypothetical protein
MLPKKISLITTVLWLVLVLPLRAASGAPSDADFRKYANTQSGRVFNKVIRVFPQLGERVYSAKILVEGKYGTEINSVTLSEQSLPIDELALEIRDRSLRTRRYPLLAAALEAEFLASASPTESIVVTLEAIPEHHIQRREEVIATPASRAKYRDEMFSSGQRSLRGLVQIARRLNSQIISQDPVANSITITVPIAKLGPLASERGITRISKVLPSMKVANYISANVFDSAPDYFGWPWGWGFNIGVYEDSKYSTADSFKLIPASPFQGNIYRIKAYELSSRSDPHVVNAAGVIRNNSTTPALMGGAASGADPLYIYNGFPLNVSYFIPPPDEDNPVPVISVSQYQPAYAATYAFDKDYARADRATLDYPWPLYVFGAGNDGNDQYVGNLPRNGLVVGVVGHRDTADRSDDLLSSGSHGKNPIADPTTLPHGDAEFPHLVAAAPAYAAYDGSTWGGTSAAAPMVASAALRMMQANNELRWYPEASRAILMATADHTISSVRVTGDTTDDLAGAGELNAAAAVDLAFPQNIVNPLIDRPGEPPREPKDGIQKGYWFGYHCDTSIKRWYVQSNSGGTLRASVTFQAVP